MSIFQESKIIGKLSNISGLLKEQNQILRHNTRWTFWAMIFTFLSVLIAILMAYLALKQVNEIRIEGAGTAPEQEVAHLKASPVVLPLYEDLDRDTTTLHRANPLQIVQLAYKIIECESNWRPNVYGDGGKAYGLAQFHKPTWNWLCGLYGVDLDYYNSQDQITLLIMALEDGRGYLWTCYNKLTN